MGRTTNGSQRTALALRWDDLDIGGRTLRIDESLGTVNRGAVLGDAKNVRSRRLVPLSTETVRALIRRRAEQAEERPRGRRLAGRTTT